MIKMLFLTNNQMLLSQIEEVGSELGEPDCKLIKPFLIKDTGLEPWLIDYTIQDTFMIHSDKILTITDPKATLLEKYQELIK